MRAARVISLGVMALLAACVPQPAKPPQAPPRRPAPAVPVPPPPAVPDWRDIPLSAGSWFYRDDGAASQALFGASGAAASFVLRCDRAARQVTVSRQGITTGNTMTLRSTFGARNLPLSIGSPPLAYVYAQLAASDPFLDSITFSRGRFTVLVPGTPLLVIPAWPEPARVVEDCRS